MRSHDSVRIEIPGCSVRLPLLQTLCSLVMCLIMGIAVALASVLEIVYTALCLFLTGNSLLHMPCFLCLTRNLREAIVLRNSKYGMRIVISHAGTSNPMTQTTNIISLTS